MFHHLPPLLAFDWPGGTAPGLPEVITTTSTGGQQAFALRGVIHYGHNVTTWTSAVLDATSGSCLYAWMQVRWTWLQLHGVGELCLPHCNVSVISEMNNGAHLQRPDLGAWGVVNYMS